jgi:hypothetical protein
MCILSVHCEVDDKIYGAVEDEEKIGEIGDQLDGFVPVDVRHFLPWKKENML